MGMLRHFITAFEFQSLAFKYLGVFVIAPPYSSFTKKKTGVCGAPL
jgi:hypothetical protein